VPAPAVIPAPIAYIKFVAVKKLVVGLKNFFSPGPPAKGEHWRGNFYFFLGRRFLSSLMENWLRIFYLEKIRVFKASFSLE